MSKDYPLPSEFSALESKIHYVRRKSANEYSSTCPRCGGSPHPDGTLPDRFVLLIASRIGQPFGFCRKCDYKWWFSKDDNQTLDPATMAALERQSQEYIRKREEERRNKLAKFTTGELWRELNERMQEEQRDWWLKQGVPNEWQDYLRLGYTPDKAYEVNEQIYHSPAYTIPYFHYGWDFKTMQYRLVDDTSERYRFEADLGSAYYMTTPSLPLADRVIVCEGAKKAMVVCIRAGLGTDNVSVLAVPSATDWQSNGIIDKVKGCGRAYILFDPDCWKPPVNRPKNWMPEPERLARAIGKNARIMELPVKADDAFVLYGMSKTAFAAALKYAKRLPS